MKSLSALFVTVLLVSAGHAAVVNIPADQPTIQDGITEAAVKSVVRGLDEATRHRVWVNGSQIGRVNALPRKGSFHVLKDDPVLTRLLGLIVVFPQCFGAKVVLEDRFEAEAGSVWVGSDRLRMATEVGDPVVHVIDGNEQNVRSFSACECDAEEQDGERKKGILNHSCFTHVKLSSTPGPNLN